MRTQNTPMFFGICAMLAAAVLMMYAVGCNSTGTSNAQPPSSSSTADEKNPIAKMMAVPDKKAGSQLWAENCTRCHNARPPQAYSDGQWSTIVHHMRLRADLTGEEARLVRDFLQASN